MPHSNHSSYALYWLLSTLWMGICFLSGGILALLYPANAIAETEIQPGTETPSLTESFVPQDELAEDALPQYGVQASYVRYAASPFVRSASPMILIYHTHTTEAYFPTEQFSYRESSRWRTKDSSRSVVAVGEALKLVLEEQYGFTVLHDTTDHEPPKLATAYERSEQTMLLYREKYQSISLYIDLHRDAYGSEPSMPTDTVTVNGEEIARIMFVVGLGESYEEKPFYATNYALADRITKHLKEVHPNLTRPIRIKKGRYNQHIDAHCLLIEVGHNANTLEQALASVPYLAQSIALSLAETVPTVSSWVPNPIEN